MIELKTNMLTEPADAIVITTNGFVTKNGKCVMGRGIAKQIADNFPIIPYVLGSIILRDGNNVHQLTDNKSNSPVLISFPVKPDIIINDGSNCVSHCTTNIGEETAGFLAKADVNIIVKSLIQLRDLADRNPQWKKILVPRVGCGAGELEYETIKPLLNYLDDRFYVCTYE